MKPIVLALTFALAILPAAAQTDAPLVHTAAELAKIEAKVLAAAAASSTGLATQQMDTLPNSYALVVARVHTGDAELHKLYADQIIVLHGNLTLVTGGTLTAPHAMPDQPDEIRASDIKSGKEVILHPGDVARILPNVPHWVKLAPNTTATYLVFKQK